MTSSLNLGDYEAMARRAVKMFWSTRYEARVRQVNRGSVDQGERSGVTSGKNMDGFLDLVQQVIVANGGKGMDIYTRRPLVTLPGYFRPTKLWDVLVMNQGRLVAALEFKSHVGPSFGNNFNNRTEEALGTATDLQTAYREGAFGDIQRPFVGWLMLLEDCPKSRVPVRETSPHFPVRDEFIGSCYVDRYNLLCRKLVQEQLYTASALLLSKKTESRQGRYTEHSNMTGLLGFVSSLAGQIAAEVARS